MHGHTKEAESKKTDEERKSLVVKAKKYKALSASILERRKQGLGDEESFDLTGKALRMNPDFYSLWNFRRDMLIERHGNSMGLCNQTKEGGGATGTKKICISQTEGAGAVVAEEFRLTADAILKNPKCYGAWHHRQWVAERFEYDSTAELELCKDFLCADQRNFHCWIYRAFVVHDSDVSCEDELNFSTEKIMENFSNYSAFHYRSAYLLQMYPQRSTPRGVLLEELEMVENAVFTEPDDQSAWWYFRFLLDLVGKTTDEDKEKGEEDGEWAHGVLQQQADSLRSLLDEEPESKWVMVALVEVLQRLAGLPQQQHVEADVLSGKEERLALLESLKRVDPIHKQRYLYLARQ